jgi:hypothetical protein
MQLAEPIAALCRHYFGQAPLDIVPIQNVAHATAEFEVTLPGLGLLVRIGSPPEQLSGALSFGPMLQALGVPVARLLVAGEADELLPDTYQIYERLEGTDLLYTLEQLTDAQLDAVAGDVHGIVTAVAGIASPGGYGPIHALERGRYDTWTDYVLDEARLANLACVVRDALPSRALVKLYRLLQAESAAFDAAARRHGWATAGACNTSSCCCSAGTPTHRPGAASTSTVPWRASRSWPSGAAALQPVSAPLAQRTHSIAPSPPN